MTDQNGQAGPELSVLMPVYNEMRTIEQALNGLLESDLGVDWELILVDDGSTDGSAEIARSFPGIRYVHQPNQGLAAISGSISNPSARRGRPRKTFVRTALWQVMRSRRATLKSTFATSVTPRLPST